jgi:hypothetical protein
MIIADKHKKVVFLEDLLNRKEEYDERDQLLIKKVELSVLRAYNSYRIPFLAVTFTLCVLSACNTRKSLFVRLAPPVIIMPFLSMYNAHIGMYGVHRKVDSLIEELL